MKNIKKTFKKLWKDESGQGATEYILLLVVIVAVVLLFGGEIRETVATKMGDLASQITSFSVP